MDMRNMRFYGYISAEIFLVEDCSNISVASNDNNNKINIPCQLIKVSHQVIS